jgi:hypothetical protein
LNNLFIAINYDAGDNNIIIPGFSYSPISNAYAGVGNGGFGKNPNIVFIRS